MFRMSEDIMEPFCCSEMPLPPRLPQVLRVFCQPRWDLCTDGMRGAPCGASCSGNLLIAWCYKTGIHHRLDVGFNLQHGSISLINDSWLDIGFNLQHGNISLINDGLLDVGFNLQHGNISLINDGWGRWLQGVKRCQTVKRFPISWGLSWFW